MKEKLVAIFLGASMLSVAVLGCGANSGENTKEETTEDGKKVETVTIWTDTASEKTIREKQIEEFNNGEGKELGIKIEYQVYGDSYTDTVKIAAQAGEAPDLYRPSQIQLPDFIDKGYIMAIEDLPGSEELLAKYDGLLTQQGNIFDGKTYALPYNLTTYGFVVNKDLLKASGYTEEDYPTTWEEVREIAKKVTEDNKGQAYGLGLSSAAWTVSSFYTFPAGQNVGHYGYDWTNQKFDYSAFNPMIETIDQMVADGSVFPGFETLDADGIRAQFAAGKIAMIGAASFDCAVYTEQFPATCDWEVIDIPKFSEDQETYKRFGTPANALVIGEKAKEHPEAVLKVLEYYYSDENAAEMYENGVFIPVRKEAIEMAEKEPDMKGWAQFASFDEIFSMPPVPDNLIKVEGTAYRDAITAIWANPDLDDVEAVMKDVDERYNTALESQVDKETLDLYTLGESSPEKGK